MLRKEHSFEAYLESTGEARVKIASANEIELFCSGLKPDPRMLYLHVIAMGAGDFYGCNKNGDYFPEKSLIMYHHTFEQNAKVFKEHDNKAHSPFYGRVVKSWYNPVMHRVELILEVDKEKAPDIVSKVERGEVPEVSMGARVPHDVCSICGNKASKKHEYCDHITKELKRVYPDGRQVYMLNLQPTFFDISFVFRRADKLGLMLKKVASAGTLNHIFDIEDTLDKVADLDKEVPAEAVVKVLNKGMFNLLPELEETEPDLPPALLDRIASRYTLKDILHSFIHSLVPIKPREVARVIVVQNGFPLSAYDDVLSGIMHSQRGAREYPGGTYQQEIGDLLSSFMPSRSSYGPHVVKRVLVLRSAKTASEIRNPNPYYDAPYYDPAFNNELNHYKYNYASVPVMYDEDSYQQRKKELANRSLREPLNPFGVALMLGAMYAAYRGVNGLDSVVKAMTSPKGIAIAGAASLAAVGAMRGNSRTKMAGILNSKAFTHYALPFVGAHLASAHYRNKYMRGEDLNGIQSFIAENPDYLSIAAPFAVHFGANKMNAVGQSFKDGIAKAASYDYDDSELKKFADFADTVSQAALTGIIFKGRNASLSSAIAEQTVDGALMRHATTMSIPAEQKQPKVVTPIYQNKNM